MKISLGTIPLIYPVPIVLIGTYVDGSINYTEVGDVAIMGIGTPLVTISLNTNHHTTAGIKDTKFFSINIPNTEMMAKADYCGIHSGKNTDKSKLFSNSKGPHGTPLIDECPVNLECKVIHDVTIKNRHIFIAEVMETFIDEIYTEKVGSKTKIADMKKLNPLIYSLDNYYYSIGEIIGEGYKEGKII